MALTKKQGGKGPIDFRAIGQWETASDVIVASKWPQKPHLALDLKWAILATSKCNKSYRKEKNWSTRPLNNLGDRIWPQIWANWPWLPMFPCLNGLYLSLFTRCHYLLRAPPPLPQTLPGSTIDFRAALALGSKKVRKGKRYLSVSLP